jgi:cardiolipin synthase (CMP-forming)
VTGVNSKVEAAAGHRILTAPNVFTLLRLCCIPLFFWMLFTRHNRAGAGWLLGGLGATDWVDGYIARRFDQVSEFGKIFDPTADRILFISTIIGIIVNRGAPIWFCVAVLVREIVFGGVVAFLTLFFKMKRFDVTWWGKTATFGMMFAIPGFLIGHSTLTFHTAFEVAAWILGIPSLLLSYWVAISYIPSIRAGVAEAKSATS